MSPRDARIPALGPDRDMWIVAGVSVVCAMAVVVIPATAVRVLFAVPLCLVLPGYALSAAAFAHRPFQGPQRLMLIPALSLAALAVGSVVLDIAPGGIHLASWVVLLLVVVLGSCAATVRRRRDAIARPARWHWPRVHRRDMALLGVAAVVIGGALGFSRVLLPAPNAIGYTQLWMLPGGARPLPTVRIGLHSDEQHPAAYRLVLAIGLGRAALVESHLTLRPGAGTQINVPLNNLPRTPTIVTARLYKLGTAGIYREVTAVLARGSSAQGHGLGVGT